jgi:hypothetical protein
MLLCGATNPAVTLTIPAYALRDALDPKSNTAS